MFAKIQSQRILHATIVENQDIQLIFVGEKLVRLMLLLNLMATFITAINMVIKNLSLDQSSTRFQGNKSLNFIDRLAISMHIRHKIVDHIERKTGNLVDM